MIAEHLIGCNELEALGSGPSLQEHAAIEYGLAFWAMSNLLHRLSA
jgi:hypothetical protein